MDEQHAGTFPQTLIDAFRAAPDRPAFEYEGRTVTRGEVLDAVATLVRGLRGAGLTAGSYVALDTGVSPEAFAVRIAAHTVGCTVIGLRPGLTREHLRSILARDVSAVVTDDTASNAELHAEAAELGVPLLDAASLRSAGEALPGSGDDLTAQGNPDDVGIIHLTSGSTGRPKGTVVTYGALTHNWALEPSRWNDRVRRLAARYERFLLFGTLNSAVVFEHLGLCLMSGGTAVIPGQPLRFPEVFAQHRITACLVTVPRLYALLDAAREGSPDLSTLRNLLVAGSPLPPHRLTEAAALLGPVVHHGYGQTETGMLSVLEPAELTGDPALADSVGRPLETVETRVRDSEGQDVPTGDTGEVWVRRPDFFRGYWDDVEETADVLRDGWVRTRDLGSLDADGYLRLAGRIRDIIIVNAIVHYAGPIERALASHPDVDQAYVVSVPDEHTGEAIHAFVVPRPAAVAPEEETLRKLVAREVGAASVPAGVVLLTEVPVAPSGKPDKAALRAMVSPR
ncbi:fatty acid--CoA ligase family protein [Streptomyces kunmingensis]|uniref:Fatty acid--CoA ligase family protein n=1 Tax=Streptomyces kunmingensis TaxID=68225 RepID=A0ABU6C3Y4_9ACTN|nr:fatty acid--CoA ligase family protein [Streptomyces kunmingensis]MEB3958801.1 fatty acid--CoA ligase family protein [Streptomyces kunmingensis]